MRVPVEAGRGLPAGGPPGGGPYARVPRILQVPDSMTPWLGPARRSASAWLLLSLVTADLTAQDVTALERLAERAMPAVVLIDVRTAADTRQGSGFLVDPTGRWSVRWSVDAPRASETSTMRVLLMLWVTPPHEPGLHNCSAC